jgi:hypothetical protein
MRPSSHGDADGLDGPATMSAITGAALAMHRAFHAERRFVQLNMCPCRSCRQTSDLKLKFVAHVGEVATQTIRRRKKLVGVDVIYVHRLLKNPVTVPEYLLVSDDLFRDGGSASAELVMHEIAQELEGIGPVQTFFVDVEDIATPLAPLPDPSWSRLGRPGPPARPPPPTRTVARSSRLSRLRLPASTRALIARRCSPPARMRRNEYRTWRRRARDLVRALSRAIATRATGLAPISLAKAGSAGHRCRWRSHLARGHGRASRASPRSDRPGPRRDPTPTQAILRQPRPADGDRGDHDKLRLGEDAEWDVPMQARLHSARERPGWISGSSSPRATRAPPA